MNKHSPAPSLCRSVFQENRAATTAEKYTKLWTVFINQMERGKKTLAGAK